MSGHTSLHIFRNNLRSPHHSICWGCLQQLRARRTTSRYISTRLTSASSKSSVSSSSSPTSIKATSPASLASKNSTATAPPSNSAKNSNADPTKTSNSAKPSISDKPGDDFVPPVLQHALGLPERPQPGQNSGIDTRTWRQRRDDFHNYEKHLQRRKQLYVYLLRCYIVLL